MKLSPVDSDAIAAVGYDPARRWLDVQWKGQPRLYRYYAVPAEVYDDLLRADSIGAYVNANVKPRYLHELVDESP
jgi:hypothetical protein